MENNIEQNKIEIKIATEADWEDCRQILKEALTKEPQAFGLTLESVNIIDEIKWKEMLNREDIFVYLSRENSNIVGMAGGDKNDEGLWYVTNLYVKNEYRNRGIAEKMMDSVLGEIKKRGGESAKLGVRANQKEAVNLYQKLGFEIIKTTKNKPAKDGNFYDSYVMEKKLGNV